MGRMTSHMENNPAMFQTTRYSIEMHCLSVIGVLLLAVRRIIFACLDPLNRKVILGACCRSNTAVTGIVRWETPSDFDGHLICNWGLLEIRAEL